MKQPKLLPAPTVPAAGQNGIINVEYLTKDLEVIIPIWQDAKPGDAVNLQVNGKHVFTVVAPDPLTMENLTAYIPGKHIEEQGVYEVRYALVNDESQLSHSTMIRIYLTAPGAGLLAPMVFTSDLNDRYDPAFHGSVPGYARMADGDVIQTFFNGAPGPIYRVGSSDLERPDIKITVSKLFVTSLGHDTLSATYYVTDRAGNRSVESQPAELTGLMHVPAPVYPEIPAGIGAGSSLWTPPRANLCNPDWKLPDIRG